MTGTQIERFTDEDREELSMLADGMIKSGFFDDAKSVGAAMVKILAGREIGLAPVESMRSLNIVKGRLDLSADLLAQRVKQHPSYDYRVRELDNDHCVIEFFQGDESLGLSTFDEDDRKRAGLETETTKDGKTTLTPWAKFPRNMMFARAMTNGVAFYCPDVVASLPPMPEAITMDGAGDGAAESADASAGPAPSTQSSIEVGDPEPPAPVRKASKSQLAKLAAMAAEFGWDDDERHRRAGVASFSDLTKAAASLLIEAWSKNSPPTANGGDDAEGGAAPSDSDEAEQPASEESAPPAADPDGPPTEELIGRSRRHLGSGTDGALTVALRQAGFEGTKFPGACTHGQLAAALEYRLTKGKG